MRSSSDIKSLDVLSEYMGLGRRSMLIGLGGAVTGGGALVGTGAFTSVEAERNISVVVAGDASALLTIAPTNKPNGEYVKATSEGAVEVTLNSVSKNAVTTIRDVFRITNNGSQPVFVYIEDDSDSVQFSGFSREGSPSTGVIRDSPISTLPGPRVIEGPTNALHVPVGLSFRVNIKIDTTGISESQSLLATTNIVAQAEPPVNSPFA